MNRCNELPLRGKNADFRLLSKFNTSSLPLCDKSCQWSHFALIRPGHFSLILWLHMTKIDKIHTYTANCCPPPFCCEHSKKHNWVHTLWSPIYYFTTTPLGCIILVYTVNMIFIVSETQYNVVVALDRDVHPMVTSWYLLGNISSERRCIVGWWEYEANCTI